MLKISIIDSPVRRRVVVEGKMIDPWAAELRDACAKARSELRGRELVLDMKHITAINQKGENLVLALMNDGVKVRCSGVFTKYVLQQLAYGRSSEVYDKPRCRPTLPHARSEVSGGSGRRSRPSN